MWWYISAWTVIYARLRCKCFASFSIPIVWRSRRRTSVLTPNFYGRWVRRFPSSMWKDASASTAESTKHYCDGPSPANGAGWIAAKAKTRVQRIEDHNVPPSALSVGLAVYRPTCLFPGSNSVGVLGRSRHGFRAADGRQLEGDPGAQYTRHAL